MYWFIFLCTLFFQAQAADDGSGLLSNDIMQRLKEVKEEEEEGKFEGEGRFVYCQRESNSFGSSMWDAFSPGGSFSTHKHNDPLSRIKDFMQKIDARPYVGYFVTLASSKLSDERKLANKYVYIPSFEQLSQKEQVEKDEVLIEALNSYNDPNYSVMRLLFAALLYAKVEVNNKRGGELLKTVVLLDDISLTKMALENGADPNQQILGNSILSSANSKEIVELMIRYGANVSKASWNRSDLVYKVCFCDCSTPKGNKLLRFYLQHIPLSASNEFGLKWMQAVAWECYMGSVDQIIERVEMLLEYRCKYNEEIKKEICERVAKKSPEAKEQIERVFQGHKTGGKNVKGAKR